MSTSEDFERQYATEVGMRLRRVRLYKRLSLAEAAGASDGEFGAAALGAYERGARIISVPRLGLLASLYDVPIEELLPENPAEALTSKDAVAQNESLRINLTKLRESTTPESIAVRNFIERVRVERHDYDGRVFTVRLEDLRILGAAFGLSESEMLQRLDDLGLLIRSRT